jgi:peptide/nickel transport system permease protein
LVDLSTSGSVPSAGFRAGLSSVSRNQWAAFVFRRTLALVLVLVAIVVLTFLMVRIIPGDPAQNLAGDHGTPQQIQAIRHQLRLDRPLPVQFEIYVSGLVRGDLGESYFQATPVSTIIRERIWTSLQLALAALIVVLVVSIPLGIALGAFTRESRHTRSELAFTAVTSVMGALPEFLTATLLVFIFAVTLRWLPVAGSNTPQALVLPLLAVVLRPIAILTRIVRVETHDTLASEFVRTARGKRLPKRILYRRHVLPHVVTAALTVGGLLFSGLIGGAVVVENIFARPGLGTELVQAVLTRDYPVVQGIVLVLGVTVVIVNAIVDMALALIDPRSLSGTT